MKREDRLRVIAVLLTACPIILCTTSCNNGLTYLNYAGADAASILGAGAGNNNTKTGGSFVYIEQLDGMGTNYPVNVPGRPSWLFSKVPLYLPPGNHSITLYIGNSDSEYGEVGRGMVGITGSIESETKQTIDINVKAKHIYSFSADMQMGLFQVVLWDITSGVSERVSVESWNFNSNGIYSTIPQQVGGHK